MASKLIKSVFLITAALAGSAYGQISRTGWSVSACCTASQTAPNLAIDNNNATRWTSAAAQAVGMWYAIDFGSAQSISQILIANPNEPADSPVGYQVLSATTAGAYSTLATGAGSQTGNTVITFSTKSVRYLNITLTAAASVSWWSIDEIYAFATATQTGGGSPTTTTTAPTCVSTVETALSQAGWTASGWTGGGTTTAASLAIDGNLATRWTSASAQVPGAWFSVNLGAATTFNQIVINNANEPGDSPAGYSVSVDGNTVATGAGSASGITTISFNKVTGRVINITLTQTTTLAWWSIDEINVYSPTCSSSSIPTTGTTTSLPTGSCVPSTVPVSNSWTRAQAIVAQMSQDQKIAYIHGEAPTNGPCVGNVPGIPSLNLPFICLQDGPSGVGDGSPGITSFPSPVVLAQTWNTSLAQAFGVAVGQEFNSKGFNVWLGPMMNIARHPYHGRIFEGSGEDPYLAGQMVYYQVTGVQSQGVVSTLKHFLNNEQEYDRGGASSEVDIRTEHEVYGLPFRWGVKAGAGAAMCSYNRINDVPACETPLMTTLLKQEYGFTGFVMTDWAANMDTVKSAIAGADMEMPFGGSFGPTLETAVANGQVPQCRLDDMVTRVIASLIQVGNYDHQIAPNPNANATTPAHTSLAREISTEGHVLLKNTGALPVNINTVKSIAIIGTDSRNLPMYSGAGSGGVSGPGIVSPWQGMVNRIGSKPITLNYAEGDIYQGVNIPSQYLKTPSGAQGVQATYYNNTNANGTVQAQDVEPTFGWAWNSNSPYPGVGPCDWSAEFVSIFTAPETGLFWFWTQYGDGARIWFNGVQIIDDWVSDYGRNAYYSATLNQGSQNNITIQYFKVCGASYLNFSYIPPSYNLWGPAQTAAQESDIAFVFVGASTGETLDKRSLELVHDPRQLHGILDAMVEAVVAVQPNTVVVLNVASPYNLPWLNSVKGVIWQGFGGLEQGDAFASLVFGDVSFSGKTTQTWAKAQGDYYVQLNSPEYPGTFIPSLGYEHVQYSEGIYVGYKHFDQANITPLYEFGFGLSYTTFGYSNLGINPASISQTGTVTVTITVTNTGSVAGAEIAQLYLGYPSAAAEPPKVLRGFGKQNLNPGQAGSYSFTLDTEHLQYFNNNTNSWQVAAGTYTVYIGASSRDIRLTGTFTVTGTNNAAIKAAAAVVSSNSTAKAVPASTVVSKSATKTKAAKPTNKSKGKLRL